MLSKAPIKPKTLRQSSSGTALILTLMLIVAMALELTLLSVILTRGVGEEAILLSHNVMATNAGETAMNRIQDKLYHYLLANGTVNVNTDFARTTGAESINDEAIQVVNPESGTQETTSVDVSAWLVERRGSYYHLATMSTVEGVELASHRWVKMTPCRQDHSTQLSILVSNANSPGYDSAIIDSTGRVFFSEYSTVGGNAWTWHSGDGLSVILSNNPYMWSSTINSNDRIFLSEEDDFLTWHKGTGVSVIVSGQVNPGDRSSIIDPGTGRVFFGENTDPGEFWVWDTSKGLSVILSQGTNPGFQAINTKNGQTVFGTDAEFWRWVEGNGLSQIISQQSGFENPVIDNITGRVFFASEKPSPTNEAWTWHASTGLSALLSEGYYSASMNTLSNAGRYFIGERSGALGTHRLYTWYMGTGLSVVVSQARRPAARAAIVANDGRFYFGEYSLGRTMTWEESKGVSILVSNGYGAGGEVHVFSGRSPMAMDNSKNRVFFGNIDNTPTPRSFFAWKESDGLSVLVTSDSVGKDSVALSNDGTLILGTTDNTVDQAMYRWNESDGLSALVSGVGIGRHSIVFDEDRGVTYFGETNSPGSFYRWTPPSNCEHLRGY